MDATHCAVAHARSDAAHRLVRRFLTCSLAVLMLASATSALLAQVDVLTNRYDGARSGANLSETTLSAANVNVDTFGKLFSYPVDGAVYAQPLYVSGVTINGALRNVVYVATMNDKVYAFDADGASTAPFWTTDFTKPSQNVTAVPVLDIASGGNIWGNVGIEGTPMIDRSPGTPPTMYLVARTKENGAYVQRLHALDITTGLDRVGSPVTIAGSVPGTAPDSVVGPSGGQTITFNPKMEQQRAALALSNGVVLVAWSGHEDKPPYHGWIMGFNAATLARVGIFAVTPDVYEGGIWQGGRAPTLDADGDAYFATGNAIWDGARNFGDSLLRFRVSPTGMALVGYFTPSNESDLNLNDKDLSGSGFTLLPGSTPGTKLLLGGGKEGVLYLLNADDLRGKVPGDPQAQKIPVTGGHVMGGPVFWNSVNAGTLIYNWSEDDVLLAYRLTNDKLVTPPYLQGVVRSPGHPGGSLTVSANGAAAGTGIVWASIPTYEDSKHIKTAGTLRAFHAETLQEIWTSDQNPERDQVGTLIKFVPPLVANGKVYMPTHDNAVAVYGLLPPDFSVTAASTKLQVAPGGTGTLAIGIRAQGTFAAPVGLSASGMPAGVTLTFSPASVIGAGVTTMTVSLAPNASTAAFTLTVTGTSGSLVHALPVTVNGPQDPAEIVLYAKDVQVIAGNWVKVDTDQTAAFSTRIENPDAAAAKVLTPQANPANYFELTFTAEAKVPYHLWLRAKAKNNSFSNDSVYVQFSGSLSDTGVAINRIGAATAATVTLEDCTNCGVFGWGWQDNGYGAGVLGSNIYFTGGPQTIRIQQREDGISIDQIVLSPVKYLNISPGLLKNDNTILLPPPPPPPPPTTGTIVLHASQIAAADIHGNWRFVSDLTAADSQRIELPDAGAPKVPTPLVNPDNYFELAFTAEANKPYRLWLRGRAQADSYNNDSVYVQFSGSVTATGAPVNLIQSTQAVPVVLEDCSGCGVAGWGWQDNGYGVGVLGPVLYFTPGPQRIRIQGREDGMSIDQIVLSPDTYLTTSPGATKHDTTILPITP